MSKKKARQRRAGIRAGETRSVGPSLVADLIRRTRTLVTLQARRKALVKEQARLDLKIRETMQLLRAGADAAMQEGAERVSPVSPAS